MKRERIVYREAYKRGAIKLSAQYLPLLKHHAATGAYFKAVECEVLAAGKIERADGQMVEFQDLRVYVELESRLACGHTSPAQCDIRCAR